jgi:hypothetical protein
LSRVLVIAANTFTQLVRMKVFYFLAIFALIAIASNFFDLPQHEGPESVGANVLRSIKSWSLGAMTLFSVVLSIVPPRCCCPRTWRTARFTRSWPSPCRASTIWPESC